MEFESLFRIPFGYLREEDVSQPYEEASIVVTTRRSEKERLVDHKAG
jgi:hypothetical protein